MAWPFKQKQVPEVVDLRDLDNIGIHFLALQFAHFLVFDERLELGFVEPGRQQFAVQQKRFVHAYCMIRRQSASVGQNTLR